MNVQIHKREKDEHEKLSLLLIVAMLVMVMSACTSTSNTPGAGQAEPGTTQPDGSGDPVTLKIVYKDEGTANPVSVKFFETLEKSWPKTKD